MAGKIVAHHRAPRLPTNRGYGAAGMSLLGRKRHLGVDSYIRRYNEKRIKIKVTPNKGCSSA